MNALTTTAANDLTMFEGVEGIEDHAEHLGQDDVSLPWIGILQQLSPQCVEGNPNYMEDAKAGKFYCSVTGELIDGKKEGFEFISVGYKLSYIEWVLRVNGGGFVKEYEAVDGVAIKTARNENNIDVIQNDSPYGKPGNQLNLTHTHYFLRRKGSILEPLVASMTSTQLKSSKNLNAMIQNNPFLVNKKPLVIRFGHVFKATTLLRQKDQNSWYVWDFERVGNPSKDEVSYAKTFADGIKSGLHKVDHAAAQSDDPAPVASGGTRDLEDEVPF